MDFLHKKLYEIKIPLSKPPVISFFHFFYRRLDKEEVDKRGKEKGIKREIYKW